MSSCVFRAEKVDFLATYLCKKGELGNDGKVAWLTCLLSGLSASSLSELLMIDYKKPALESLIKGVLIRRLMETAVNQLKGLITGYEQDVLFYKRRQMLLVGEGKEKIVQNFCALKYSR